MEVRSITHSKMPICSLTSLVAVAALFNFGPEELGGGGDLWKKVESISHLEGTEWDEEADKVDTLNDYRGSSTNGSLLHTRSTGASETKS